MQFLEPTENSLQLSSSVDLLQNRSRQISDQSLQSTRRMVGLVDESKEVGIRTRHSLGEQGERLNLLDESNRRIREEVQQSERALTHMEKCCGLCALPWNLPRYRSAADQTWKKTAEEKLVSAQPRRVVEEHSFPDGILPRITNDAGEEEMESNLSHVHSTVRDLKGLAAELRGEARAQNQQLDQLALQADSNDQQVVNAAQRADKLHR